MPNDDENLGFHHLRRDYTFGTLVRSELPEEPIPFFKKWFAELQSASLPEWFELNAMTLSTTNDKGASSSRIVLLKQLDSDGFCFYYQLRFRQGDGHRQATQCGSPFLLAHL